MKHVVGTDIIEPAALILMGINIELNGQVLTVLNIELTNTIFTEDAEDATLGILTGNFNDIVL